PEEGSSLSSFGVNATLFVAVVVSIGRNGQLLRRFDHFTSLGGERRSRPRRETCVHDDTSRIAVSHQAAADHDRTPCVRERSGCRVPSCALVVDTLPGSPHAALLIRR